MAWRVYPILGLLAACDDGSEATPEPDAAVIDGRVVDAGDGAIEDAGVMDAEPVDFAVPEACPRPTGEATMGDANGDGVVDLADPAAIQNHLFRAGPAPACLTASDLSENRQIDVHDSTQLLTFLGTGFQVLAQLPRDACAEFSPFDPPGCAGLGFGWRAPTRVSAPFEAVLHVVSPDLPVQAWSTSIRAEGCRITEATVTGTPAAEIWDDPPGLRHLGYTVSRAVDGGAVTLNLLSLIDDLVLPPGATPVLRLQIVPDPPMGDCLTCTLTTGDGLTWTGPPIESVLVVDGLSWRPPAAVARIEICP